MPELPEVETIKTELSPHIIGRAITGVTLLWEGIVRQTPVAEFRARITGQRITALTRRGKYLIVTLSGGDSLIIHLKMSGSLIIGRDSSEPPRFTRAILHLDGDTVIFFRDPRKFGLMQLVRDRDSVISKLGPEPLQAEFTPDILARLLAKRKAPIKALLCDQEVIAGIGNMYADEALFAARLHPRRAGGSLSQEEIERLYRAIGQVLLSAIGSKGASIENYFRPDGTIGTAHFGFNVAHRGGEPCPNCGMPIERLPVRNRGSYFCPRCQPAA